MYFLQYSQVEFVYIIPLEEKGRQMWGGGGGLMEGPSGEEKTTLVGLRNVWSFMPEAETRGPIYFFFSINSYRFPKKQTIHNKTSC